MSLYKDASLVMIPSAYKDGKLYSIRPTDGSGDFAFSRGSNLAATRVDVNGLIEKGRENLLLQSNQFDTTWSISGSTTLSSGQSGYDGSNNAWLLSKSGGEYRRIYQAVAISGVCTLSVYAKANTLNQITLRDGSTNALVRYDLSDGSLVGTAGSPITYSIVSVGNGWWRCSLTMSSSVQPSIYVEWSQSAAGSIYIQDAQLEQGLVATDYIETTTTSVSAGILEDMPRLDYSGGASCGSLLLEPSRTNSIPHSDYFGAWTSFSSISLSNNAGTSPEGVTNATEITWGAGGSRIQYDFPHNATSATYSVFIKSNGGSTFNILLRNVTTSTNIAEEIFTGATFQPTLDTNSPTSVDYGNGWYRVSITATSGITSGNTLRTYIYADNGGELLIYGAQAESGSYPTSYIPTYGTSQTRSIDDCKEYNVESLLGTDSGTIFVDFEIFNTDNYGGILEIINDSTPSQRLLIWVSSGQDLQLNISGGIGGHSIEANNISIGRHKAAFTYSANEIAYFVDGIKIGTATPTLQTFAFSRYDMRNSQGGVNIQKKYINQTMAFPTALTDSECIALTTL